MRCWAGAPNAELTDRLIAAIRERETLLILDNCEHVIESAAAFAHRMLGECRRLRIVATSREPLGITGEALWLVDPLALPDACAAACQAAAEAGHAPLIAQVLVGVADLALRRDEHEQAARLLAASAGVRGLPDRSHPDVARIEQMARLRLGDARFAEAAREGTQARWSQLVTVTLAS